MYLAPQAGHAPHLVPLEWADRYKGVFDEGYEAIRAGILARQIELGLLPEDTELSPINPHGEPDRTGPDGQPWPLLDTVRPVGLADRRRAAPVRPHGRGVRRLHLVLRRPARPGARLPRGVRASSTTRSSSSSPTTAPAARAARTAASTSGASSTASPTPTETTLPHIDELGTPASNNHYNTGWAWALDTPFPYWKRWAGDEGGVADMCLVSWPAQIAADAEPRHQYVHAVDVVPTIYDLLGIEPPEVHQGLPAEPDRGRELRRRAHRRRRRPGKRDAVLRDARPALDLPRGLAGLHRAPAAQRAGATSSRTSGSCSTSRPTGPRRTNLAADEPERLEELKGLWFYYAGIYNGLPARRPLRPRAGARRAAARRARPRPVRLLPGLRRRARVGRPADPGPLVHDRGRRRRSTPPTSRACIWAAGGVPGGHSLYVKDGAAALHVQLGRHPPPGRRRRPRRSPRAPTCCAAEFAADGPEQRPGHARRRRAR